jgi:hypothetical protein
VSVDCFYGSQTIWPARDDNTASRVEVFIPVMGRTILRQQNRCGKIPLINPTEVSVTAFAAGEF